MRTDETLMNAVPSIRIRKTNAAVNENGAFHQMICTEELCDIQKKLS